MLRLKCLGKTRFYPLLHEMCSVLCSVVLSHCIASTLHTFNTINTFKRRRETNTQHNHIPIHRYSHIYICVHCIYSQNNEKRFAWCGMPLLLLLLLLRSVAQLLLLTASFFLYIFSSKIELNGKICLCPLYV